MRILYDLPQQGDEWRRMRAGKITASKTNSIITPTGKLASNWKAFADELFAECVDPLEITFFGNRHTDRGNEQEQEAREMFANLSGFEIIEAGFVLCDNQVCGCSPDGLIMDGERIKSGLEIKCPETKKQISYLMEGVLPPEYKPQVHTQMAFCETENWWFMSYNRNLRPFIIEVKRDSFTDRLQESIEDFVIYYSQRRREIIEKLRENPFPNNKEHSLF